MERYFFKANQYQLNCAYVRTSFRIFDDEMALSHEFEPVLHYRWWYAIKYGIGLITHSAPYAWLHGISDWYIASSKCIEDGNVVGASYPTIDNYIKFCGCSVHHDGFEWNRQQKTHFIVEYSREHPDAVISLRVCYKSADGDNCCHCEKCYRTMTEFFVEGEDPRKFGINYPDDALEHMKQYMTLHCNQLQFKSWNYAKRTLRTNWEALRDKPWRNKLEWMLDFNFDDLESNPCRIQYKKSWKIKGVIVKMFTHLYKLYVKKRGYSYDE